MKTVKIFRKKDSSLLLQSCEATENSWERARGLLGRRLFASGEGLLIEPCNGVHTFFMQFPIDVLFLDKERRIVGMREEMRPWRMSAIYWKAHAVLELPSGEAGRLGLCAGEALDVRESKIVEER